MKNFLLITFFLAFILGFFYPDRASEIAHKVAEETGHLWKKGHVFMVNMTTKHSRSDEG